MSAPPAPAWLDVRGAAARAGVSVATIQRLAHRGRLRAYKILGSRWRFRPDDIDKWIEASATPQLVQPAVKRSA